MFSLVASTILFHTPEARIHPVVVSSHREIDGETRASMEETARGNLSQGNRAFLAKNGWQFISDKGLSIFIDLTTTRYGLKYKQFQYHKSLVEYFKRFPTSEGYASEEFTSVLKEILQREKGIPTSALPKRLSLGRKTSLVFAVSEKHRQESGSLTASQTAISVPWLEQPRRKLRLASDGQEFVRLVILETDNLTELNPSKNEFTKANLINSAKAQIDKLTRELDGKDSMLKEELLCQACTIDRSFDYLHNAFKRGKYASLPIRLRASVEDQLRKTIRPFPKTQFFSNAIFWPVRVELEINVNLKTSNGPQTISITEILKDYPTQIRAKPERGRFFGR